MSKRMERYGGGEAVEGAPVDPMVEWASPSGETGLEGQHRLISVEFRLN